MRIFPAIRITKGEKDVILLSCSGKSNYEIAKELYKSYRTIEGYKYNLVKKFNANNFNQVIADCFRLGLVN